MPVKLTPGVLLTETEYGMALLDQGSGEYWTLNPTAAVLLRALLDGNSEEQAVGTVTEKYRVSAHEVEEDMSRILAELRSAKLVVS